MIKAGSPSGTPKSGGRVSILDRVIILAVIWKIFKIAIPLVVGIIVGVVMNNIWFGIASCSFLAIWFWTKGLITFFIIITIVSVIIGLYYAEFMQPFIEDFSTNYGIDLGNGLGNIGSTISCTWCQATNGINNPAVCEKKCDTEIESTDPLLEVVPGEITGVASPGIPFSFEATIRLLNDNEVVKNLRLDFWVTNTSKCGEKKCIPEEMSICPTKLECLEILKMPCGGSDKCKCESSSCELNKDENEKTISVFLYNPTCHGKDDITLIPYAGVTYDYTVKTFYKVRVAEVEASEPSQKEGNSIGPVSLKLKTDKSVYSLDKLPEDFRTGTLTMKVINAENGEAYINSMTLKQEYSEGLQPFVITDCPGFTISNNGLESEISLETGKTFSLTENGDYRIMTCTIEIPSEGINNFNEYTFTAAVNYEYRDEIKLTNILLDCGQKS